MLSEMAEFLQGALREIHHGGVCPTCAATLMGSTREDMVKATKELILHGVALAQVDWCTVCNQTRLVAYLRRTRPRSAGGEAQPQEW